MKLSKLIDTVKLRVPDNIGILIQGMHPDLRKKIKGSLQTILSDI